MSKKMLLVSLFVVFAAVVFSGCQVGDGGIVVEAVDDLEANTKIVVDGGKEVIKATVKIYVAEPIKVTVKAVGDGLEEGKEAIMSDIAGQVCETIGDETCDWIDEQVK